MAETTLDLNRYRERLLEERNRVLEELKQLKEHQSESQSEELGELTVNDEHQGEIGTSTFERERDLALEDNLRAFLEKINLALRKIEEGTYGICDLCGQPIHPERLEFFPWVNLCIEDQARLEGSG